MLVVLFASGRLEAQDESLRRLQGEFNQTIKPLLQKYCYDCHGADSPAVGLDLNQYQQIDQMLGKRKLWRKLEQRVLARSMPPEDAEPLSDADYLTIKKWLDMLLNSADCVNRNPGRVTLRRLNRFEYQNTIRDLVGVEYQPASDFPGDDVGYGFDNIADVMSLPPILMEKYLSAAEQITAMAIVDTQKRLLETTLTAKDFRDIAGVTINDEKVSFLTKATLEKAIQIPQAGDYRIEIEAAGDQAGNEPVRMTVRQKGRRGAQKKIRAQQGSPETQSMDLRFDAGRQILQISFDNDYYVAQKEDRNLLVYQVSVSGPLKRKLPATHVRWLGNQIPVAESEQLKKAKEILHRFGSRAFRRALTSAESDQLLNIFRVARAEQESFEAAIRYSLQAILVSPHFLFKVEKPLQLGQTRELNDFELATSLSYFLWSSMPDEELFRVAGRGELRKPEVYRQQIDRMLADRKSGAFVDGFVVQWLQLRKLDQLEPDPTKFPGIDMRLRQDMITETKLLVADLIHNKQSLLNLLDTEHTFVNNRLAEFYGLPKAAEDKFRKVSTKGTGRAGLLTQASILTVTSNPTRTSPVKRGKWIMENLLGEEPPPPDPAAMPIENQRELTGNLRQRMEQHRADPNCAACHKVMDQLGFALENFDAVGRWRKDDDGHPIDASGKLPAGQRFSGALEMQRMIRDDLREDFVRCLAEKMLIYATGRGLEYFDECAVDKIISELRAKNYSFAELIRLVATSEPFMKRKG
jgi:hypothetical protein